MIRLGFIGLIIIIITGCTKKSNDIIKSDHEVIVATIDKDTLTLLDLKDFMERDNHRQSDLTRPTDRHRLLNELVNDRLIMNSITEQELSDDDSAYIILKNAEDDFYVNRMIRLRVIYPNIPEQEILSFYNKIRYEINVRQLFVFHNENQQIKIRSAEVPYRNRIRAKKIADSLYALLAKDPGLYESLIEKHSDDEETKFRQGEVGFIHYDKYDPAFRDLLFEMKDGQLSGVLESRDGFHVFMKMGQRLTENIEPLERIRPSILASYAELYEQRPSLKMVSAQDLLIDSLEKAYGLKYDDKNIGMFLSKYQRITKPADLRTIFSDEEKNAPLAAFGNDLIPVKELVWVMSVNRTKVKLDRNLMIVGLKNIAVRRILSQEAKKKSFNLLPHQRESLADLKRRLLKQKTVYRNVDSLITISDKDIKDFYSNNRNHYREPDMVSFNELFSLDETMINQYYREIKQNGDFTGVAKNAETVKGNRFGTTGLTEVTDKQELTVHAWKMNPGDLSEPFTWSSGGYSIIQLIEKKSGRQLSFEEVQDRVYGDLYKYQRKNLMIAWIAKLRDRHAIVLHDQNLADIYDVTIK